MAETALAVRDIITGLEPLTVGEKNILMTCQIGMNCGPVFIAEIGELRGRREFTLQGDVVNTAARLMSRAAENQILLTENVYQQISQDFECEALGAFPLKGKAAPVPLFALHSRSLETG